MTAAARAPGTVTGVPIDLGADPARELARRELARAAYLDQQPGLGQRLLSWVGRRLADLFAAVGSVSPGGGLGLLVIGAVLVAGVLVVRWRLGRLSRNPRVAGPQLDLAVTATAAEHRERARGAEAAGDREAAVREWMRALVRGLEERDLLAARPGRTAGDVARTVTRVLPDAAEPVTAATRAFDEVVYGGRRADPAAVAAVRGGDESARGSRPAQLA